MTSPPVASSVTPSKKKRRRWSEEEDEAVRNGVRVCGVGNWTQVRYLGMPVLRNRTPVDIKDRFVNLKKRGEFENVSLGPKAKKRRENRQPICTKIFDERSGDEGEQAITSTARRPRSSQTIIPDDDSASDEEEQDCKPAAKPRHYRAFHYPIAEKCSKKRSKQTVVLLDGSDGEGEVEHCSASNDVIVTDSVRVNSSQATIESNAGDSDDHAIDRDELNAFIDELFVQSNRYIVKTKDFIKILESQFGLTFDKSTRDYIRTRIGDLNHDRVEPLVSHVNKHETNSNHLLSNCQQISQAGSTTSSTVINPGESADLSFLDDSYAASDTSMQQADMNSFNANETTLDESNISIATAHDESRKKDAGAVCEVCVNTQDKADDDELQQDVVRFHQVAKVLQECNAYIRDLTNDRSRNQFETESEIAFWQERVNKWRTRLPLSTSDSSPSLSNHTVAIDVLSKQVDHFLAVMEPIKECQSQIQSLANDNSKSRMEVATETIFWRRQEQSWKSKLPL
eukprot:CAMPEP_0202492598 /NCGR_PEP_ID=MMETSP1361-20130828/9250_1 /ASSEMBLY_ACC=CAM_ASM_000849 /TAXON_ID=210615 /ORGANISM="Staurosira complex sp., Strain CCMP2646" /LENGTH=511 /DNA_ID=CAMNT_0049122821 /DNA_START=63 /DNA_END=1598 /DNA_ORIENTATION=+